jgi:hypothetical protein
MAVRRSAPIICPSSVALSCIYGALTYPCKLAMQPLPHSPPLQFQAKRDGLVQARGSIETLKARIAESEKRIDSELEPFIKKNYWCVYVCVRVCKCVGGQWGETLADHRAEVGLAMGLGRHAPSHFRKGTSPCTPCRTEGREQLRRQVGTLRFDINALADTLPKAGKKDALAAKKVFISEVRVLAWVVGGLPDDKMGILLAYVFALWWKLCMSNSSIWC